jgi:hypothetical protein
MGVYFYGTHKAFTTLPPHVSARLPTSHPKFSTLDSTTITSSYHHYILHPSTHNVPSTSTSISPTISSIMRFKKTLLCRQRCSSLGHDDYKRDGWTQTLLGVESLGCWRASYRPQHPLRFPDSHRLQHHQRAQNAARQHREAAPDGARCLRHPLRPRYPQTGGFGARSTARTIIVGALNRLFASGTGFGRQTKVSTPRKMRGRGNRSPPSTMSTEISASSSTRTPKKPVDAHRGSSPG